MGFTYYGDLLGIDGYYGLSPKRAYIRLNDFYNATFGCLSTYCKDSRNSVTVNMFSDSLLIWGDDEQAILAQLQKLYLRLVRIGLLLRGAIVKGRLQIDPRLTLDNFKKMLPSDDTLARAAGLEQTQKGARLLIENALAEDLLENCQEWLTQDGYIQNIRSDIPISSLSRRICPTPDNKTYELLYLWPTIDSLNHDEHMSSQISEQLKELSTLFTDEIAIHYKKTLDLLIRCSNRREYTERQM